jgi:hypothetical protein
LKQKGVGVTVLGVDLTSTQFADNTQVLLPSQAEVPAFLQIMDVFAAASGQHLNRWKTKLLLLGPAARRRLVQQHQQQQDAPGHELQTALSATLLGVCIGGDGEQSWDHNVEGVMHALSRLSCLTQLSAFGRGLAAASYGISKLFYCAELCDPPLYPTVPASVCSSGKTGGWGVAPDTPGRGFAGVSATLLQGKPKVGSFGFYLGKSTFGLAILGGPQRSLLSCRIN